MCPFHISKNCKKKKKLVTGVKQGSVLDARWTQELEGIIGKDEMQIKI